MGSSFSPSGLHVFVTFVKMAERRFGDRYDHMGQLFIDRCVNESIVVLPWSPEALLSSWSLTRIIPLSDREPKGNFSPFNRLKTTEIRRIYCGIK